MTVGNCVRILAGLAIGCLATFPVSLCDGAGHGPLLRRDDGAAVRNLIVRLVSPYSELRSFQCECLTERLIDGRWVHLATMRIREQGRRIRCDFTQEVANAIQSTTILRPEDIDLPAVAAWKLSPRSGSPSSPSVNVGDQLLSEGTYPYVSSAADLAVRCSNPVNHKTLFPLDADPIHRILWIWHDESRGKRTLELADGEYGGVPCKVITSRRSDVPDTRMQVFIGQSPLRTLGTRLEAPGITFVMEVLEWCDSRETGGCEFPRVLEEYYVARSGDSKRERFTLRNLAVNEPLEDDCFRLAAVEWVKPGISVNWLDGRRRPCDSRQALIWDGEKLVCGELGGPVAEIAPVHGTSILRRLAQWSVGLGAAGVALVLFRSIRRRAGRGR